MQKLHKFVGSPIIKIMNKISDQDEQTTAVRTNSLGWWVNAAAVQVNRLMKQALENLGLTQGQFAILMTLLENDDIPQTAIAKRVDMPDYAITRNLDVLEAKGLLARHNDLQSRRSFRIRLTEAGRALQPTFFAIVEQVNTAFMQPLTPAEGDQLKGLLMKLLKNT